MPRHCHSELPLSRHWSERQWRGRSNGSTSMRAYSKSGPLHDALKSPSQTPSRDQRRNRVWTDFQCPGSGGRSRHGVAPRASQRPASTKSRLSAPPRPPRSDRDPASCLRPGTCPALRLPPFLEPAVRSAPTLHSSSFVCSRSPPFSILSQKSNHVGIPQKKTPPGACPTKCLPLRRQGWIPVLSSDTRKVKGLESVWRFCHRQTDSRATARAGRHSRCKAGVWDGRIWSAQDGAGADWYRAAGSAPDCPGSDRRHGCPRRR